MMRMAGLVNSALLGIIEQAGLAVATLVEGQPREDLLRSRLTRAEVLRQLLVMADAAAQVDPAARARDARTGLGRVGGDGARFRGTTGAALDRSPVVRLRITGVRHAAVCCACTARATRDCSAWCRDAGAVAVARCLLNTIAVGGF